MKLELKIERKLEFGERLGVVGNLIQVGLWKPGDAFRLIPDSTSFYHASILLTEQDCGLLEYKYILLDSQKPGWLRWENCINRVIEIDQIKDKDTIIIEDKDSFNLGFGDWVPFEPGVTDFYAPYEVEGESIPEINISEDDDIESNKKKSLEKETQEDISSKSFRKEPSSEAFSVEFCAENGKSAIETDEKEDLYSIENDSRAPSTDVSTGGDFNTDFVDSENSLELKSKNGIGQFVKKHLFGGIIWTGILFTGLSIVTGLNSPSFHSVPV
eukprot:CAMPEP_0182446472 /NCGR_PEP_ID=MMETSP1172-20130603/4222_1 /TAXON_ID=708627 /ORGANISM="Timspurckia oligopyrenoides, Strain CCMP3278" /LENGTH=270 /DNA_ID=CAMNT_0024642405 /DNA_START=51 /DNA_END=863 /DNA_ORIENTATION=+